MDFKEQQTPGEQRTPGDRKQSVLVTESTSYIKHSLSPRSRTKEGFPILFKAGTERL